MRWPSGRPKNLFTPAIRFFGDPFEGLAAFFLIYESACVSVAFYVIAVWRLRLRPIIDRATAETFTRIFSHVNPPPA